MYLLKPWWNKCFINDFIIVRLNVFYLDAVFGCCKVCISACCSFTPPGKMTEDVIFKIIVPVAGFFRLEIIPITFFQVTEVGPG